LKLPRDWSGDDLARRLSRIGYVVTRADRQPYAFDSHNRSGTHHVTVPRHDWLRTGTLANILDDVAGYLKLTRDELLDRIA